MHGIDCSTPEAGFGEALRDVYEGGLEWDRHKALSQRQELIRALQETLGYRYADEVEQCSTVLALQWRCDTGDLSVRPFESCRRRWCPVCEWRKSLRRWALLVERLPGLIEAHGPCRFILLTLTVRNTSIDDLPTTVTAMTKGWRALTNKETALGRLWPAGGWIRVLELTFPRPGEVHPHYHVLMAVRPSYFSHGYVTQAEWTRRWQQAMRLDYTPVVDVRRVKPLAGPYTGPLGEALGGLAEVSKYITKPGDTENPDALRGLFSLKNKKFVESGGWLRGVLRDIDQLDLPEVETVAQYWWRAVEYRRKLG